MGVEKTQHVSQGAGVNSNSILFCWLFLDLVSFWYFQGRCQGLLKMAHAWVPFTNLYTPLTKGKHEKCAVMARPNIRARSCLLHFTLLLTTFTLNPHGTWIKSATRSTMCVCDAPSTSNQRNNYILIVNSLIIHFCDLKSYKKKL